VGFGTVVFGHKITFKRDDGRRQAFRIVGEDESSKWINFLRLPIARALIGKAVGDVVSVSDREIEVLSIE
jgi:transcription elongation GreA/GreB family factor